jgi:hypothetical protein
MTRRIAQVCIAVCWIGVWITIAACGYQMAGRRNSALPGDAKTIGVKMLVNRSIETGAEAVITNALADELNRRRPGTLKSADHADAILSGRIESILRETVARVGTLTASQERVTVTLSLALKDASGNTLWERSHLTAQENYGVVRGNKPATEGNRRQAILRASKQLAENVYRGLTDNF